MARWLLPESIADALPAQARRIENLRRSLLDLYRGYGYELVLPPMIEYLDSLLTGSASDLNLRTFKLVDQLSGRTLGVRADMTPQVARIDAHRLDRTGVTRLCYAGSVLHTRPATLFATREPIQIGAELYGHEGIEADLEVIELMARSLIAAGSGRMRIDLCHVGIVPALIALDPGLAGDGALVDEIHDLLQAKDVPGLAERLDGVSPVARDALLALPGLYGPARAAVDPVGERARRLLPPLPAIGAALDALDRLCSAPLFSRLPGVELSIDLADLRGYRYHSGITFAAYVAGPAGSATRAGAVARGGRYDNVGAAFGRARPATGFSLELRSLAALQAEFDSDGSVTEPTPAVRAPWADEPRLAEAVARLRAAGEVVIQVLPGHEHEQQEFNCDRQLCRVGDRWVVEPL